MPGGGDAPAGQHVEQGRLAGAVGPDHPHPVAGSEEQVDPGEHGIAPVVGDAHAGALDHLVAEPGHGRPEVEFAGPGRLGRPAVDQGPGRGDAGPGFAAAGLGPPAQPGQLRPGEVAPGGLGRRGLLLPLGPGLEVGGVAPLVDERRPPVELEHAGGDPVQQVAVVGDEHEATGVGGQPVLQPRHPAQVEVVGGLVQDEQVARVGQDPGQRHPLGLAARQTRHVAVDGRRHPQPVEGGRRLPSRPDRLPDGSRRQFGRLVEEADPDAATPAHRPRVRFEPAGQDRQQRRLAGAVDADHAEAVTGGQRHRQAPEQGAVAPGDAHVLQIDEHGHRSHGTAARNGTPTAGGGAGTTAGGSRGTARRAAARRGPTPRCGRRRCGSRAGPASGRWRSAWRRSW